MVPILCYQHDLHVQRNSYGLVGWQKHTGWHIDAGSELGNIYLCDPEYRFAKCGIFLQDFDNGWGGGIRVKVKTHRDRSEQNMLKKTYFFLRRVAFNRLTARLRIDMGTTHVPTRAGDLCFFDSRLLHASAAPSRDNIRAVGRDRPHPDAYFWPQIPSRHTKYVLYWDACNTAMAADFLRNSMKRSQTEPEGMIEKPLAPAVWTRILALSYPCDFPPELRRRG